MKGLEVRVCGLSDTLKFSGTALVLRSEVLFGGVWDEHFNRSGDGAEEDTRRRPGETIPDVSKRCSLVTCDSDVESIALV